MTRWQCPRAVPAKCATVRPATDGDLPAIAGVDAEVFGADRRFLLRDLLSRTGAIAMVADDPASGFALSRRGRVATQIGPVVARDGATAIELVDGMLGAIDGPVLIDVFDRHEVLIRHLEALGFARQRPFERMARGPNRDFGVADRSFVAAGPELG
jgi:hypothetical protein